MKTRFWFCFILSAALVTSIGCGHRKNCCRQATGFASPTPCCPDGGTVLPPANVPSGF